jgi:hypothetical protein
MRPQRHLRAQAGKHAGRHGKHAQEACAYRRLQAEPGPA